MALKDKLDALVGKTIIYEENFVKILRWEFLDKSAEILLHTANGSVKIPFSDAEEFLAKIKPLDQQTAVATKTESKEVEIPVQSLEPTVNRTVLSSLRDELLQNIARVKDNKEYMPQAKSISESVGQIIELAKVEIEFAKTDLAFRKMQRDA